MYAGYVNVYSESGRLRELLLRDAEIYDFDGNKMFNMPAIYIERRPDDIHVEFPYEPNAARR